MLLAKLGSLQGKDKVSAGERGKQKEHWICNQKMGLPSLLFVLLAVTIQASHFASLSVSYFMCKNSSCVTCQRLQRLVRMN